LVQTKQRVSTATQSTGGFDRLLPHTERDLLLLETPKGTILTHNDPASGEALSIAVEQEAKLWELRAAGGLAQLAGRGALSAQRPIAASNAVKASSICSAISQALERRAVW
jgi:hypothetical protein